MPAKVTIIMNCHNGEEYLKEAIDSIFSQSFTDWVILFFDNNSKDTSADIANSYDDRLVYHHHKDTVSLGHARNLALEKVDTKYVSFLDCDDLYCPDKLQSQIIPMEEMDYGLSYGSAKVIDKDGKEIGNSITRNKSGYIFGNLLDRYEINMQSVVMKTSLLRNRKLNFPTHYEYGPDYDLFMRLASETNVLVIKDPIVKTRIHENSLSRKTYHRVHLELGETLNSIAEECPDLREKFSSQFKNAFSKIKYYEAISYIHNGNFNIARKILKEIIFKRLEYAVLFFILFMPISRITILKLLNRAP